MRCFITGFVFGVILLHQQAQLLSFWWCCNLVVAVIVLWIIKYAVSHSDLLPSSHFYIRVFLLGVIFLQGLGCGVVWTNAWAIYRLSDVLKTEHEVRDVLVTGVVDELPSVTEDGAARFVLQLEDVVVDYQKQTIFPKRIQLTWHSKNRYTGKISPHPPILPGQRWQLLVRLKRPHGYANPYGRNSEIYFLEQHIQATGYVRDSPQNHCLTPFVFSVMHCVHQLRFWLRQRIEQALTDKAYQGILVALIVGDQQSISQPDWQTFRQTGISHLVAISGLHITLVSGFLSGLFAWGWRRSFFTGKSLPLLLPVQKARLLCAIVVALMYVTIAGWGIPAQRALFMLCVVACGLMSARVLPASFILSAALFFVVLCDPWAVFSAGCWLSFAAVAFIFYGTAGRVHIGKSDTHKSHRSTRQCHQKKALIQHTIQHYCCAIWIKIQQAGQTQYVVTLGLLPFTVLLFGQYSLISPIANAVAIPVVTLSIIPCLLLGAVLPSFIADWLWSLAQIILSYLMTVMHWLADLPWAFLYLAIPDIPLFLLALAGTLWFLLPQGWPCRAAGCLTWLPLLLQSSTHPDKGDVAMTVLDVGQGMAVLVETAHHRLLYDTGPVLGSDMDAGNLLIVPYLQARGIRSLDQMMISHRDNDHSGGALSVMKAIPVSVLSSSLPKTHPIVQQIPQSFHCVAGQAWQWDGVSFEVLHPLSEDYMQPNIKSNAMSCVLKVSAHGKSMLLAGDIEAKQEKALLKRVSDTVLQSTILLAPHHGSGTSSTVNFLQAVQPEWGIFQVGYRNQFHHPKDIIWKRYDELGVTRLRTDIAGAIDIRITRHGAVQVLGYRDQYPKYWYSNQQKNKDQ